MSPLPTCCCPDFYTRQKLRDVLASCTEYQMVTRETERTLEALTPVLSRPQQDKVNLWCGYQMNKLHSVSS